MPKGVNTGASEIYGLVTPKSDLPHRYSVFGASELVKLVSSYRVSPDVKKVIDRQVDEILEKGIIQESVSPWSSPVVLVKKKDGSYRFCVDFRKVNKVTKVDSFPMPLVADALDCLAGASVFSVLDLKSVFWISEFRSQFSEAYGSYFERFGISFCFDLYR